MEQQSLYGFEQPHAKLKLALIVTLPYEVLQQIGALTRRLQTEFNWEVSSIALNRLYLPVFEIGLFQEIPSATRTAIRQMVATHWTGPATVVLDCIARPYYSRDLWALMARPSLSEQAIAMRRALSAALLAVDVGMPNAQDFGVTFLRSAKPDGWGKQPEAHHVPAIEVSIRELQLVSFQNGQPGWEAVEAFPLTEVTANQEQMA